MKSRIDRWMAAAACIALCGVLTACGQKEMIQDIHESAVASKAAADQSNGGDDLGPEIKIGVRYQ